MCIADRESLLTEALGLKYPLYTCPREALKKTYIYIKQTCEYRMKETVLTAQSLGVTDRGTLRQHTGDINNCMMLQA